MNHEYQPGRIQFHRNRISPITGKLSTQRHITAIRDGFISAIAYNLARKKKRSFGWYQRVIATNGEQL